MTAASSGRQASEFRSLDIGHAGHPSAAFRAAFRAALRCVTKGLVALFAPIAIDHGPYVRLRETVDITGQG
jgi:hypothetical protein